MAVSTADVKNDAAEKLSLAGSTVRRKDGIESERHVAAWARLLAEAKGLPRSVILSSLAINTLRLAIPLILLLVLQWISAGEAPQYQLLLLIAGLCCALISEAALRLYRNRLFNALTVRGRYELQMHAGRRLLNTSYLAATRLSPHAAAEALRSADDLSRLRSGAARLAMLDVPFIALSLAVIWLIGGEIVLVPMILLALFVLWSLKTYAAMKLIIRELIDRQNERYNLYRQCIEPILTVKMLAVEPHFQRRLESTLHAAASSTNSYFLQNNRLAFVTQNIEIFLFFSVVAVGGVMAGEGMVSIVVVAICAIIASLVAHSTRHIIQGWQQSEAADLVQARCRAVMDLPQRVLGDMDFAAPAKVQLNRISMNYPGRPERTHGVNLTVMPGEIIGIVFRDDNRRQLLSDMIRGKIEPDHGEVLIDGEQISVEHDAALKGVMLVSDEPAIFSGTILDNISMFGCINPVTAVELAQRLDVEATIQKLPHGYETKLDHDSPGYLPSELLIAIALVRAAAIRPRLLILDIHRLIPSDISTGACEKLIEVLRGVTTFITLGRTLIESINDGSNYRLEGWSLTPIDPILADQDESFEAWEAVKDD